MNLDGLVGPHDLNDVDFFDHLDNHQAFQKIETLINPLVDIKLIV